MTGGSRFSETAFQCIETPRGDPAQGLPARTLLCRSVSIEANLNWEPKYQYIYGTCTVLVLLMRPKLWLGSQCTDDLCRLVQTWQCHMARCAGEGGQVNRVHTDYLKVAVRQHVFLAVADPAGPIVMKRSRPQQGHHQVI